MPTDACISRHRALWAASGPAMTARRSAAEAQEFLSRIVSSLLPAKVVAGNLDDRRLFLLVAENLEVSRSYRVQMFLVEPEELAGFLGKPLAEVRQLLTPDDMWAISAVYRELDLLGAERLVVAQVIQGTFERSAVAATRPGGPHGA